MGPPNLALKFHSRRVLHPLGTDHFFYINNTVVEQLSSVGADVQIIVYQFLLILNDLKFIKFCNQFLMEKKLERILFEQIVFRGKQPFFLCDVFHLILLMIGIILKWLFFFEL
jgi:hypothetical protein